jgi:hypothetical protein
LTLAKLTEEACHSDQGVGLYCKGMKILPHTRPSKRNSDPMLPRCRVLGAFTPHFAGGPASWKVVKKVKKVAAGFSNNTLQTERRDQKSGRGLFFSAAGSGRICRCEII